MTDQDESPLKFPCTFPIKVMGQASDDFDAKVFSIVRRHAPDLGEGALTRRASRGGNYVSVTVVVNATSRDQLDAIYRELTACDWVLMAL